MVVLIVVLVVVVLLVVVVGVAVFNKLVRLRNQVEAAWAQIDVQLQRRNDLIPNLVETVKGYAAHERATLEAVINARNAMLAAKGPQAEAAASDLLTGALGKLFALSEAYPDLKANQNFLALQEELTATEDKVSYARQRYNDLVRASNTAIQSFPGVLLAGAAKLGPREYFEAADGARTVPNVTF
jgi:LemA protein